MRVFLFGSTAVLSKPWTRSDYHRKLNLCAYNVLSTDERLLHIACANGHLPVVKLLLDSKADVNARGLYGKL
eukprot:942509-Amorphochlora_amoeboformis.AAC.1